MSDNECSHLDLVKDMVEITTYGSVEREFLDAGWRCRDCGARVTPAERAYHQYLEASIAAFYDRKLAKSFPKRLSREKY